jgi:hypothetical protein
VTPDETGSETVNAPPPVPSELMLDYRPPREDDRPPSGLDVLRGGFATIFCIVCLGPGILFIVGVFQRDWDEPWKPYICLLCGLLALSGSLASIRSARFYFSGRKSSAYNFKLWGFLPHRRR